MPDYGLRYGDDQTEHATAARIGGTNAVRALAAAQRHLDRVRADIEAFDGVSLRLVRRVELLAAEQEAERAVVAARRRVAQENRDDD